MKVHRDDHPGVLTLAEIKSQIALGALTKPDLWSIIDRYCRSDYYLPEDVLTFLEKYLNTTIRDKNKFYLRNENSDEESE
ncbi:hypothetical protein LCGC14_1228270 [marine sediment metagenome]|uniref:Uncharacterized protein n=1 Tax=marine sediment metagenome TaxID=412755 RepID=A0A0F9NRK1_9ZZZZ